MAKHTVQVVAEVTARPDEIYHYWNERSGYPRFVPGLRAVELLDEVWSRWRTDDEVQPFDVEMTDVVPRQLVSWRCHRAQRDRTTVRLHASSPGATRIELAVSWHADDDRERENWRSWAVQLLEAFTVQLRADHAGYVEALVADEQVPHTD